MEHHFGNHQFCGDFCETKEETEHQQKVSDKFCWCEEKDKELHLFLLKLVAQCTTMEKLKETAHGMDTQANQ